VGVVRETAGRKSGRGTGCTERQLANRIFLNMMFLELGKTWLTLS
jgi:hypothetical protein